MGNGLWNIYCAPGYLVLWVLYLFPTEWGMKRNTVQTGRQWKARGILAPLISTAIYIALIFVFLIPWLEEV